MMLRQSATVHVCALRHVPEMVKHTGARHLIIALADKVMRREGRMIAALHSMGECRAAYDCTPFGVEAMHEPSRMASAHKAA